MMIKLSGIILGEHRINDFAIYVDVWTATRKVETFIAAKHEHFVADNQLFGASFVGGDSSFELRRDENLREQAALWSIVGWPSGTRRGGILLSPNGNDETLFQCASSLGSSLLPAELAISLFVEDLRKYLDELGLLFPPKPVTASADDTWHKGTTLDVSPKSGSLIRLDDGTLIQAREVNPMLASPEQKPELRNADDMQQQASKKTRERIDAKQRVALAYYRKERGDYRTNTSAAKACKTSKQSMRDYANDPIVLELIQTFRDDQSKATSLIRRLANSGS
jgi:hypothetical protein